MSSTAITRTALPTLAWMKRSASGPASLLRRAASCSSSASGIASDSAARTRALRVERREIEMRVAAEHQLQALEQRRKAGAESADGALEARAGIGDLAAAAAILHLHADHDLAAFLARVDAMSHRILDQRQQCRRRAAQGKGGGIDLELELQAIGHAHVHQLKVCAHQLQLLPHL